MQCKCDAAQAAGKAIEDFVNFHSKMLLPSVDYFGLCHRTVMLNTSSCVPWRVSCWNLWGQRSKLLTTEYQLRHYSGWLSPKGIQAPQSYSVIHRRWAGVCNLAAMAIKVLLSHLVLFAKEQQRNCNTSSSPICCVWMVVSYLQI